VARATRARTAAPVEPAARLPVARVAVDTPLPHLDRPFDYLVTEAQSNDAQPGCRVRVRFSGKLVDGFLLERADASGHQGRLARLERVVSPVPVLTTEIATLARAVADRWAGTLPDVTRLAVPPRHASAEAGYDATGAEPAKVEAGTYDDLLAGYDGGTDLVTALASAKAARAVLQMLPGDWPGELARLAALTLAAGRGVVIVVPDHNDVARVDSALTARLGPDAHVVLTAELGPAERYRRFLSILCGSVRCVVGTRAAVWAPVADPGLVAVWDDGDDLLAEPRAPYCHARDVALLRAHLADTSVVVAGHAVTAESASLAASGWARLVLPTPAAAAARLPKLRASGDDAELARDPLARSARLPSLAWRTAKAALDAGGPVLVQVPRRGYLPSLACAGCRTPARCPACAGPLARAGSERPPTCRWCGRAIADWRCSGCGGTQLRASVVGAGRTTEELGRAFPGVTVRTSSGDGRIDAVPDRPVLVVATPGAEPVADGGYAAALLLDGWSLLARPDLRAGEEALRRWLNAAALVRAGGQVVVVAPGGLRPVQALLRWAPAAHAERELAERAALHLPPAARMAALTGTAAAVRELLELAEVPPTSELLGPVPVTDDRDTPATERMLVRVPRRDGAALAAALKVASAVRSARKTGDPVRVELDPQQLG
jgi:primosomal protein N' (replication factor Y)